jgi:NhaP-type Na+/H+ or K+/H+ antiporter
LFGGALASGVLDGIGWREIAFAPLALLVVRPVATLLGFIASKHPAPVRLALGYFGIRGLGSLYYISYAVGADPGHNQYGLWSITALVVLLSVGLYGATAQPALRLLDRAMGRAKADG